MALSFLILNSLSKRLKMEIRIISGECENWSLTRMKGEAYYSIPNPRDNSLPDPPFSLQEKTRWHWPSFGGVCGRMPMVLELCTK